MEVRAVGSGHRVEITADYGAAATGTPRRAADALDVTLRGFDAYARGSVSEAESAFRAALELQPGIAAAHFGLGIVLGDRDVEGVSVAEQGVAALAESVRLAPWLSSAHARLAVLESERGNHQSAERHARIAIQGHPRHAPTVAAILGASTDSVRARIFLLPPVADDVRAEHALEKGLSSLGRAVVNHPRIALTSEVAQATHAARMELQRGPFRSFRSGTPVRVRIHVFARDDPSELGLDLEYRYHPDDDSEVTAAAVQVVDQMAAALMRRSPDRQ